MRVSLTNRTPITLHPACDLKAGQLGTEANGMVWRGCPNGAVNLNSGILAIRGNPDSPTVAVLPVGTEILLVNEV